jgi:hypothetical protein
MQTTIEQLRQICQRCRDDSDAQLRWLGRALSDFLDHRCRTVDEALGLRFPRGGIPWWREEAARKRNAALRELAVRYYGEQPVTAQARQLFILSLRYAASAWRHDQKEQDMPVHYRGTDHEWLWTAFASGAPMPIRERQLRHVLQGIGPSTVHGRQNGTSAAAQSDRVGTAATVGVTLHPS